MIDRGIGAAYAAGNLNDFEFAGPDRREQPVVIVRGRHKARAPQQWNALRDYLHRLQPSVDSRGIEILLPHVTVDARSVMNAAAPPFHLPQSGECA